MSSKGTLDTVKSIRDALNKELPLPDEDTAADTVERCQDLLDRLNECDMTLEILSDTMIGKAVSSLKSNAVLGSKAKDLVKKWKKIAKASAAPADSKSSESKSAAAATSAAAAKAKPKAKQGDALKTLKASAESEWAGLPGLRQNICNKFFELVLDSRQSLIDDGINVDAVDQLLPPRAAEIESALWSQLKGNKKPYTEKARSLVFNLRKNASLTQQVILGQVSAEDLCKLSSEELASDDIRKKREEEAKRVIDSTRLDWEQANEAKINEMCGIKGDLLQASLFTCHQCKSVKTTSTQKQTRSADEPMTVFVLCLNCGKRWKC